MLSSIGIPQLLSTSLPGGAFAIFSFVFVSICVVLKFVLRPKHHPSIPPGPPGRLFFGHVLQFPRVQPWFKLTELGHKYGSIVRLSIFSRKYIVLNSYEDVNNLFDKRSEIYAYRPPQTMVQLCGLGGGAVLFQNGGNKLRDARKLLSAEIGQRGIVHHHGLMQDEARFMARRLLDAPGATSRSMEVTIMSWRVLYMIGFGDQTLDETLAKHATVVGKLLSDVTQYDKYLVDSFPILRYLPEWVPGCGFKKTARESKESVEYFLNVPFEDLRRKMIDGTSFPCFVSKHLGTADRNNDLVKWTAASLFGGGLTTTTSILMSFFLAMTLHPDVQVKAQEELDCVLGPGALPTFADRERLPYIECILKELLRWHPVVPLIAHSTLVDDEYKGFKIPARSIIVANSW
ncbi:hypothetical protein M0805_006561 [Coniferiporia weirii]|nr:hypothetical protein M0805_006561 [Coniferiporia weirii]